ncbi:hypothetical protein N3Z16_09835 (plasmid) [Candidatus Megaera polyxenophila]|nr:hypothetical protein N3Z16_09835 [Candidatus Megaera polyxenophila]
MMLPHHGALDKLKLFHLEDGGFHHQRDYKTTSSNFVYQGLGTAELSAST